MPPPTEPEGGRALAGRVLAGRVLAGEGGRSYRLERFVAAGGMGSVFRATELSSGEPRAVKLLSTSLAADDKQVERFRREVDAARASASPHVVRVFESGHDPSLGSPWLAMELLEGETLATRLATPPPLGRAEALDVLAQLARALDAAHAARVVHRDVKPQNIFLCRGASGAHVKLLDLGIAKFLRESGGSTTTAALGSPAWMAPEQLEAGSVTAAADVWAYGLVAFVSLSGRPFWRSAATAEGRLHGLLLEITGAPIPRASERAAHHGVILSAAYDGAFSGCLARDPTARFRSAGDAYSAFEAAARLEAEALVRAPAPAPPPAPRQPEPLRRAAGAAIALAVVLSLGAVAAWRRAARSPEPGSRGEATALATTAPLSGRAGSLDELPVETSTPPLPEEFARVIVEPCVKLHAGGRTPRVVVRVKVKPDGVVDEVEIKPRDKSELTLGLVACLHARASRARYGAAGANAVYAYVIPAPVLQ